MPTPKDSELLARYQWVESNRPKAFATWADEIAHAESQGYQLAPPEYHIPHWTTAMSMGDALPKIYVMRHTGIIDELKASFDRPTREIGYPIFFIANAGSDAPGAIEKP